MSEPRSDTRPQVTPPPASPAPTGQADAGFTPYKQQLDGIQPYAKTIGDAKQRQKEQFKDMAGRIIGVPLPIVFMDSLMIPRPTGHDLDKADFKEVAPKKAEKEQAMYDRLVDAVKKAGVMKHFMIRITASSSTCLKYKPDGAVKEQILPLPLEPAPTVEALAHAAKYKTVNQHAARGDKDGVFNFHEEGLQFEIKRDLSADPIYTLAEAKKKGYCERNSILGALCRGQLAGYARQAFAVQHRTHLFQLVIIKDYARFVRWDRAGAIFSDRFNYVDEPQVLADFLLRYDNMTPAQRGWDTSAVAANNKERHDFTKAVNEFIHNMNNDPTQRKLPNALKTFKEWYPIYKLNISTGSSGETKNVLVQAPFYDPWSPCGRATRVYLAYVPKADGKGGELKCLKDTWRVEHALLLTESKAYTMLRDKNIPYVPRDVFAADILNNGTEQTTITQDWAVMNEKWRPPCGNLRRHVHTRILQPITYPAEAARNSKEYCRVILHCILAILAAFVAGLVHRDVSVGNVMMNDQGEGVLGDWDHAGEVHPPDGYQHQSFRTGTWQFMSIALLRDPNKKPDVMDDLEACFWILLYVLLHFFANTCVYDSELFDEKTILPIADGSGQARAFGGNKKRTFLADGAWTRYRWTSVAVEGLVAGLGEAWQQYHHVYSAIDNERNARRVNQRRLASLEKQLSELRDDYLQPSFWQDIFDEAFSSPEWDENDAISDKHPQKESPDHDRAERHRTITSTIQTTSMCSEFLGNNDVEEDSDLTPEEKAARKAALKDEEAFAEKEARDDDEIKAKARLNPDDNDNLGPAEGSVYTPTSDDEAELPPRSPSVASTFATGNSHAQLHAPPGNIVRQRHNYAFVSLPHYYPRHKRSIDEVNGGTGNVQPGVSRRPKKTRTSELDAPNSGSDDDDGERMSEGGSSPLAGKGGDLPKVLGDPQPATNAKGKGRAMVGLRRSRSGRSRRPATSG